MQFIRHKCPKCGSDNISRSKRRGMIETFISSVGVLPYRCNQFVCGSRFFIVFPNIKHTINPPSPKNSREDALKLPQNQIND